MISGLRRTPADSFSQWILSYTLKSDRRRICSPGRASEYNRTRIAYVPPSGTTDSRGGDEVAANKMPAVQHMITDRCPQCGVHRKSIEASDRPDGELEVEDQIQVAGCGSRPSHRPWYTTLACLASCPRGFVPLVAVGRVKSGIHGFAACEIRSSR